MQNKQPPARITVRRGFLLFVVFADYVYAALDIYIGNLTVDKGVVLHPYAIGQLHCDGAAADILKTVVFDGDILVNGGNILMAFAVDANKNRASSVILSIPNIAEKIVADGGVGQGANLKPILKGAGQIYRPRSTVVKGTILNKQIVGALQNDVAATVAPEGAVANDYIGVIFVVGNVIPLFYIHAVWLKGYVASVGRGDFYLALKLKGCGVIDAKNIPCL